jgi:heme/copper-type cytochrome/quinol oxidase subunit 3
MTHALPAGPQPAPRRQVFIGTGLVAAAASLLIGGMLSVWLRFRANAPLRESSDGLYQIKDWLPENIKIPEVVTNVNLGTFAVICVMAQWAVYSSRRRDSKHTSAALGLTLLFGVAAVNALVSTFTQMEIGVADGAYQSMFYAITGTLIALVAGGMGYTLAALFKSIGGRAANTDLMSAHALYWYFLAAAYTAVWFVVYVQK